MWICQNCTTKNEDCCDFCWKCGADQQGNLPDSLKDKPVEQNSDNSKNSDDSELYQKSRVKDILSMKTMIAPGLIVFISWLAMIACAIIGIGLMCDDSEWIILGILVFLIGPFLIRIITEYAIVQFQINNTLNEILIELKKQK